MTAELGFFCLEIRSTNIGICGYYLKQQKVAPYDQVYTDKVSFMLTIAQDRADQICEGLTSLSGGKAEILEVEEGFFPLSVGESD